MRMQSTSDIIAPIAEPTLASLAVARLAVISSLSSYAVASKDNLRQLFPAVATIKRKVICWECAR